MPNRQVKLNKKLPPNNPEETLALMDLLFEATRQNNAHCARLMGINTATWHRWSKDPPKDWYWPIVLREAIKHTLSCIIAQRRATSKKFQRRILEKLSKIPRSSELEEAIAEMAYEHRGAEKHLKILLTPGGMWWSDIQLAANSGGYTKQTLRKAAKALHVVMTQEGFGADKDSFWRLPSPDED